MKTLNTRQGLFLILLPLISSVAIVTGSTAPMLPDDEDCQGCGVEEGFGGSWGFRDCDQIVCDGTRKCTPAGFEGDDPNTWITYCGCPSAGGEPECCHMRLENSGLGTPFLPVPHGDCSAQDVNCPLGIVCHYTDDPSTDIRSPDCVPFIPKD